jgi:4-diphosphocytidyl-2-C-methyl-D-erythritol kinase
VTRRAIATAWAEAQAKVNLGLVVTGRRADGFHTLESLFVRLALHDHLEARPAADAEGPDELDVHGDPSVPIDGNIVLRAVAALRSAAGARLPALHLRLDKHIPVSAGLGGGSSDAAAAMRLAIEVWGLPADDRPAPGGEAGLPTGLAAGLAAGLGADVPFFVSRHAAARAAGLGERLEPLPAAHPGAGVLLVTPPERLSTGAVFAALAEESSPHDGDPEGRLAAIDELARSLRVGLAGPHLAALAPRLRDANELWAPAARLLPRLPALRERLEDRLGQTVLLTGSGPTLVALYPSAEAAAQAASSLESAAAAELRGATIIATSTSRGGPS